MRRRETYTKGSLARLYYPGVERKSANRRLMRDISRCGELSERLLLLDPGFRMRKSLTIKMVRLIMEYLGEPE